MKLLLPAFIAVLGFSSCSLNPGSGSLASPDINGEYLTQHWVHSREEEPPNSTVEIYRPNGPRDFPPSRFRMRYIFEEGGTCSWYYLAPDDAHYFRPGSWRVVENNVLEIVQGDDTVHYRVVELTGEVLRLRRIDTAAG